MPIPTGFRGGTHAGCMRVQAHVCDTTVDDGADCPQAMTGRFAMTPQSAVAPRAWQGRMLVLVGIVLAAFNLRTAVTSLTPLLDMIGRDFAFGPATAGVLGMLAPLAFAVFGVLTSRITAWIGLERTAALAMALATLGLATRGFVGGTGGMIVTSFVALAGMGIGNVALPPLVKRYFPDRIGTLSSIYITVLQLGTMLPAFVAVPLSDVFGWRVSLGSWALVSLLALLPWLMLLSSAHAHHAEPAGVRPPAGAAVWRSPLAWALCAMFGMTSLNTYALFTWLPRWFVEAGASPSMGGAMLGVFSALGLLSSLVVPQLATRLRQPFLIVIVCLLMFVIGYGGMLWAPLQAPLLWAAALGLVPSTFPLGLVLINLRTRSAAGSTSLSAFVQGVGYAAACLGPIVFGLLHDMTGQWYASVGFLAACMLVMAIGGWIACGKRYLEDEWLRARA